MFDNLPNFNELKQVINVLFAIVVASCIIIVVTTNMTDKNGLSALIGGYIGLQLGMLFTMIIITVFTKIPYLDMTPIIMVLIITGLIIYYLHKYFDNISEGHISSYYSSFSVLSAVVLFAQIIIIFRAIYAKNETGQISLFKPSTFSLLGLISVINMLIVITIGIILHFYSTQG